MVKEKPQPGEAAEAEELAGVSPAGVMSLPDTKPKSNIYTLLLILAIIFIGIAIYLVGWELRNYYKATFGFLQPLEETTISSHTAPEPAPTALPPEPTPPSKPPE